MINRLKLSANLCGGLRILFCLFAFLVLTCARAETPLEIFYEDIQAGLNLDLTDPPQLELLTLYLTRKMPNSEYPRDFSARVVYLGDALKKIPVTEKPSWSRRRLGRAGDGQDLLVRAMGTMEAPFRGYWGQDCSSDTRFFRAFQPGHRFLAIEREDGTAFGQIELVLGTAAGYPVAFLERFQIPYRLKQQEVAEILFVVYHLVKEAGLHLVVGHDPVLGFKIYEDLGHSISNQTRNLTGLQNAFPNQFQVKERWFGFQRVTDVFTSSEYFKFIAALFEVRNIPVANTMPSPQFLPEFGFSTIPAPRHFNGRHDYVDLVRQARIDVSQRFKGAKCVEQILANAGRRK